MVRHFLSCQGVTGLHTDASVSIRTVENHRPHISQKLRIKGHHKLLQFALENKGML